MCGLLIEDSLPVAVELSVVFVETDEESEHTVAAVQSGGRGGWMVSTESEIGDPWDYKYAEHWLAVARQNRSSQRDLARGRSASLECTHEAARLQARKPRAACCLFGIFINKTAKIDTKISEKEGPGSQSSRLRRANYQGALPPPAPRARAGLAGLETPLGTISVR